MLFLDKILYLLKLNFDKMKKNQICLLLIFIISSGFAQKGVIDHGGGEYKVPQAIDDCISDKQREVVFKEITANREKLKNNVFLRNAKQPLDHPLFIWPVTKNPTAPYNNVWSISNHVDHNPNYPNQLQDWNCGGRTYDTSAGYNHKGIDIYTWPFSWYQFQNNQAWVIAAAPGIIINKTDGNFDMSCGFNNNQWNAIYVQHSDGSVAWYGHMKSNSLTSKGIGDIVEAGEFLGVVGSLGNSTGPHLHFEVYNSANQLIDTYLGNCNNWTSSTDSWWLNQKPYQEPKINAVLTHSQVISFNSCPQVENTYLSDNFTTGSPVVISVYLADQLPNTLGTIQIIRPNNTIADSFNYNFTTFYYSSYWYWTYNSSFFNQSGQWKLRFTYLGNTVEHLFNYGTLATDNFEKNNFDFYPNPSDGIINIENESQILLKEISIHDISGKKLMSEKSNFKKIDVSNISSGVYIIKFESENGIYSKKFIKK
jgi:murein DD-endopeptidase MepM/ murein hydrolase activator NlpD